MLFAMFNNLFYKKWRRRTHPPRKREDALQFFKEERTDSGVYNLYLKKVRYHTPASDADEPVIQGGRVSHLQWRTIELKVIKAGVLEKIVEAVSMHETGELDSSYVNVLLATFRSFTTTKELLDLLMQRYIQLRDNTTLKQHIKETHQKSVRTVISVWLDGYPEDFNEPLTYPCLQKLIEFAQQHIEGGDLAHRAKHRLHKFIANDESSVKGIEVEDVQFNFNMLDEINVQADASFLPRPVEFEFVPDKIFAEQLTYMDMELFKKVVPHHCLGSVWSRREKKNVNAPSVYATINQFNAVSYRVIATILKHPDLHQEDRAAIIEKWIDIAHELRLLKNFSSLKAIISGLQSNPVYRLHKVWAEVDADSRLLFHELSAIFSEENNHSMARELLFREGTAKFADMENTSMTLGRHQRKKSSTSTLNKKKQVWDPSYSTAAGTIPYLGTFLTDLTMIDTANPDYTEEKWINFEKKRKEFETLAQIKLLQSACQLYQLKPDAAFIEWFHSIRTYDDRESYELSCEIEPATPSTPKEVKGHRKKSSLGFFSPRQPVVSMESNLSASTPDQLDTISVQSVSPASMPDFRNNGKPMLRHSISVASLGSVDDIAVGTTNPWTSPENRVVKVSLETTESHHTNYYKSILLTNSDHTKNVLRKIFIKFNLEANIEDFVIFQVWPEGELQIPEKGNVFYAINNTVPEIKFLVRKRSDIDRIKSKQKRKKDKLTL